MLRYALIMAAAAVGFVTVLTAAPEQAAAVVCAKGVYRAGCAGPRGSVTTTRPITRCYYRAGRRVCTR
jgi:hypothetical protein